MKSFIQFLNENNDKIGKGDIVKASTYVGGDKGFEDLKYKVDEIYFDEMENKWMTKLIGIDWIGHNINYTLSNLKK